MTVGGAISTGSHGSGYTSLSASMIGCRLVTAAGEVVEIGQGDDRLDAVRISLEMLGVLTSVTLRAVPAFHVRAKRMRIPTASWKQFLTEGEMSFVLCFPYTDSSVLIRVDVLSDPVEIYEGTAVLTRGGRPNFRMEHDRERAEDFSRLAPMRSEGPYAGWPTFNPRRSRLGTGTC